MEWGAVKATMQNQLAGFSGAAGLPDKAFSHSSLTESLGLIVFKVFQDVIRKGRNIFWNAAVAHGFVTEHAHCDCIACGDRRGVGFCTESDKINEILNGRTVCTTMIPHHRL